MTALVAKPLVANSAVTLFAAIVLFHTVGCGAPPRPKPASLERIDATQSASVLWSKKAGSSVNRDAVMLSPYVSDESVFAVDGDGRLTSFDIETGEVTWTVELEKTITSGVSGDDDNVYVASGNGDVFAISQLHGGTLWTSSVSSEVIAAPVAGEDYVVVRSLDGKVYALEKSSGERRWIYTYSVPALSIHGNGRPTVVADGVLVGLDNGNLVALRSADGRVFWEIPLGNSAGRSEVENLNDLDADVHVFEPFIYAVNYQGSVAQVDPTQGSAVWSSEVSSVAGLAVSEDQVIVTDEFDTVWAFNRADGETLWKQETLDNRRLTGPVITDSGVIAVGDVKGYLHLLSAEDGEIVGRLKTGVGAIAGRPIVREDSVFVQGRDGRIAAVDLSQ